MSKHLVEFPAQLHNLRNTTLNEVIVGLKIDNLFAEPAKDLMGQTGREYMVIMIDVTDQKPDENAEDPIKDRFMKKLHAMIGEYADLTGEDRDSVRNTIKKLMIEKGMIEESMKEADYKDLARACNLVDKMIKEHGAA